MLNQRMAQWALIPVFLASCNGANFSGKSVSSKTETVTDGVITCHVNGTDEFVGTERNIIVTANGTDKRLFQKIVMGSKETKTALFRDGNEYRAQDTASNKFKPADAGTYTVELRRSETDAQPIGGCSFKAKTKQVTPEPEKSKVSCTIAAANYTPGRMVPVSVNVAGSFTGTLIQKVTGPVNLEQNIIKKDGKWVRADGAANSFIPSRPGTYQVSFETLESENSLDLGSCRVTVKDSITCKPGQESTGAHLAFLIDNSYSNVDTDCPSRKANGTLNGQTKFECQKQTNREKAVLNAFDTLANLNLKSDEDTTDSDLSVISFPGAGNNDVEWTNHTNGWMNADFDKQSDLEEKLQFARVPQGATPYGAGLLAANSLFGDLPTDDKSRIAILVTDGEPTDRNPNFVADKAVELKEKGVELITVYVTNGQERDDRKSNHIKTLKAFEQYQQNEDGTHYYDSNTFDSFDKYIEAIYGNSDSMSLVEKISSKEDPECKDSDSKTCARLIFEVKDSNGLEDAIHDIVQTRAVPCANL